MLTFYISPVAQFSATHWATGFCQPELVRLAQIRSEKRRQEFIAGHRLLRLVADHSLGCDVASQAWQQLPSAAPQLLSRPDVLTSISHSNGWVAAAVLPLPRSGNDVAFEERKLGVDIEIERERRNLAQLAAYSFGEQWLSDHKAQLLTAFFQRWTLCEALVKGSEYPLGTRLLRGQQFLTEVELANTQNFDPILEASNGVKLGPWVSHFRFTQTALFESSNSLHLSLCSPIKCEIKGFCWQDERFVPIPTSNPNLYRAALS